MITLMASCKKDQVPSVASNCHPSVEAIQAKRVTDAAVIFQASGVLAVCYQLMTSKGVVWSACNLPDEYKRNGLVI